MKITDVMTFTNSICKVIGPKYDDGHELLKSFYSVDF